jgi:hypothetical protein
MESALRLPSEPLDALVAWDSICLIRKTENHQEVSKLSWRNIFDTLKVSISIWRNIFDTQRVSISNRKFFFDTTVTIVLCPGLR